MLTIYFSCYIVAAPPKETNGYLRVRCNGGLNQQRSAVCNLFLPKSLNLQYYIFVCIFQAVFFFWKCMSGASLTKSTSMVFQCVGKWWKEFFYPCEKEVFFYQNNRFREIHMLKCCQVRYYDVMPFLRDLYEKIDVYFLCCCRFVMLFLLQESWTLHLFCLSWMQTPSGMMTGMCF